jgi:hypothetical protein
MLQAWLAAQGRAYGFFTQSLVSTANHQMFPAHEQKSQLCSVTLLLCRCCYHVTELYIYTSRCFRVGWQSLQMSCCKLTANPGGLQNLLALADSPDQSQ